MKGILLKPDLIRATVEGRKTHTRRLRGLEKINECPDDWELENPEYAITIPEGAFVFRNRTNELVMVKPYVKIGETAYIKEAWRFFGWDYEEGQFRLEYKDGGVGIWLCLTEEIFGKYWYAGIDLQDDKWRPPLFMPEFASRHKVNFLSAVPKRLHDMTEEDIKAEGFDGNYTNIGYYYVFGQAWNSMNPDHTWDKNEWVIDYGFRLEK